MGCAGRSRCRSQPQRQRRWQECNARCKAAAILISLYDRPSRSRGAQQQSRDEARRSSMTLRIHNTLTRALEELHPIEAGHVRMYVCGITVYDLCHVGHARMMMAFDVVYRWLRRCGYRRHLRAQHHRHRRQDHQARARARHHDPRADRRDDRGDARRPRRARRRAADARAARHRLRAADARPDRRARRQGPGLPGAATAT